jgi:hypothetical protein
MDRNEWLESIKNDLSTIISVGCTMVKNLFSKIIGNRTPARNENPTGYEQTGCDTAEYFKDDEIGTKTEDYNGYGQFQTEKTLADK